MNTGNHDKLRTALEGLERDIKPERDLWPAISARIAAHSARRVRPLWSYGLAAGVLLAACGSLLWFTASHRAAQGPVLAQATEVDPYLSARASYAEYTVEQAPNVSPQTRAVILKNLKVIEGSMQQIQQALKNDPNNTRLRSLLYDLYQNEAALLAATQQIQTHGSNNVRTDL